MLPVRACRKAGYIAAERQTARPTYDFGAESATWSVKVKETSQ